jgi:hypothetical protein
VNEVCRKIDGSCPGGVAKWTYPDGDGSSYFLQVQATASAENAGFNASSGHLKIVATFPTANQSALPVLNGLGARLRPVEIRFCMASSGWTYCNNPAFATSADDNTNYFLIKAVDRPPLS